MTAGTASASVVVCAYTLERWSDTVRAVESAVHQQPAPDQVVLVIDHNDELLALARAEWAEHATVRVHASTGRRGLSGARNTGIAHCTTDVIAFLDDDATARPGWLRGLLEPFADAHVQATGGTAVPSWPTGHAPAPLPSELLWVVGCTFTGQPTTRTDVRNVMGCSMAFRSTAFAAVGGFAEGIGRVGNVPLGCEETELCIRVRQHDPLARVVFVPEATVDHRVSPDRTRWRYLTRRSYAEGVSKAVVASFVGSGDALESERAYTRSVLPRGVARALRERRPAGALAILVSLACAAAGYLRGRSARVPAPAAPVPAEVAAAA